MSETELKRVRKKEEEGDQQGQCSWVEIGFDFFFFLFYKQ
jgi:hypothetical protein